MFVQRSLAVLLAGLAGLAAAPSVAGSIEPFDLGDVRLSDTTYHSRHAKLNLQYMLDLLEPDRLLWTYRKNAGLPTPGDPFTGSWEDPACEVRGQFMGHYLSALAMAHLSTGNSSVQDRLTLMVTELGKVQAALGEGYLSAFPTEHFDRLQGLQGVWAPYYVIHKIMTGLLDAHQLAGHDRALPMVKDMAAYFLKRIDLTIKVNGTKHWHQMLEVEFGGMNDVMYRLYRLTQDPKHLRMAQLFDKPLFYHPLVAGQDILPGIHANTHLAQVNGFVTKHEATGDPDARRAVQFFFDTITQHHSYATGGSNVHEFWELPDHVSDALWLRKDSHSTQETCTQYNMLKIARSLFLWTGEAKYADYYERALNNGILGVARLPEEDQEQVSLGDTGNHHWHGHGHSHWQHDHDHDHGHQHKDGDDHSHYHKRDHDHDHWQYAHDGNDHPEHGDEDHWHGGQHQEVKGDTQQHLRSARGSDDTDDQHHRHHRYHHHRHSRHLASDSSSKASGTMHTVQLQRPAGVAEVAYQRAHENPELNFYGFQRPPQDSEASNKAGPGVYLYLTAMGAGQSKEDNYHGWGYPLNSFWCCYGTAVESMAKLADSIFFRDPSPSDNSTATSVPRLYVNQLVSSSLTWTQANVSISMTADMYAPGPSAAAALKVLATPVKGATFELMLRIPSWALADHIVVKVKGKQWDSCPGAPQAGAYCSVHRTWHSGDTVELLITMRWCLSPAPENRPVFQGLKALMMGPYVMAGLTQDTRLLVLMDEAQLPWIITPATGNTKQLVSLKAGWDDSLYLRHDHYQLHMSRPEDGGDRMDATFQLVPACQEEDGEELDEASFRDATHARGRRVMLESLGLPGYYLAVGPDLRVVMQQVSESMDGTHAPQQISCQAASFTLIAGLDGQGGTLSLEAASWPGHYLSASPPVAAQAVPCVDYHEALCQQLAAARQCTGNAEALNVTCRASCQQCGTAPRGGLSLQPQPAADAGSWAAASSFRLADPLRTSLPAGAHILQGLNRKYMIAPLSNLIDERYTVYFEVHVRPDAPALLQAATLEL